MPNLLQRLALLTAATAAPCTHHALGAAGGADPPLDVVVILLDDVPVDQLALYAGINPYTGADDPFESHVYPSTPNLMALAAEGVTFTNAHALPVCSPSRASLLTGNYPSRTGVTTVVRQDHATGGTLGGLSEFGDAPFDSRTLAELAQSVGVTAGFVGKWHLSLPDLAMGASIGSELWLGWAGIAARGHWDDLRSTFWNLRVAPSPGGELGGYYSYFWHVNGVTEPVAGHYATVLQLDEAAAVCNSLPEPFVVLVAPNACHSPWHEPPPAELVSTAFYLEPPASVFRYYGAMLEALDARIGAFLEAMIPARRNRTVFVIVGDNGADRIPLGSAAFDEGLDLGPVYQALLLAPEERFKSSVYQRGTQVPLIVSGHGIAQPGRTSEVFVDIVDVFPTVAELIGAQAGDVDGISFLPVLESPAVGIAEHARQHHYAEVAEGNGRPWLAKGRRDRALSLRLEDGRVFSLVRRAPTGAGPFADELYELSGPEQGAIDPFQLAPLDLSELSPYHDEYLELRAWLDPDFFERYCQSTPNSTGAPAVARAEGGASVAANDLLLVAGPMPSGMPGYFLYGPNATAVPFGNGTLCVAAGTLGTFRLGPQFAGPHALLVRQVDIANPPYAAGTILPGSTWRFQAWFRDPAAGGASFDLSDAIAIAFEP